MQENLHFPFSDGLAGSIQTEIYSLKNHFSPYRLFKMAALSLIAVLVEHHLLIIQKIALFVSPNFEFSIVCLFDTSSLLQLGSEVSTHSAQHIDGKFTLQQLFADTVQEQIYRWVLRIF